MVSTMVSFRGAGNGLRHHPQCTSRRFYLAVAQKTGTNMEPWQVETWSKTRVTPPV